MKFYINKQIIDRFKKENINSDYIGTIIIILTSLYEKNTQLLDDLDDGNKSKRVLLLYRYLSRKGLLETPVDEDDECHYQLTEKGVTFTNFLLSFDGNENEVYKEMLSEVIDIEDSVSEWINEWLELFPQEKHFNRSLRTNARDCADRMKWFRTQYFYTKDEIFRATKNYLECQRISPDGHKYTRNSTYFISKGRGSADRISDLATECEKVKNTKEKPTLVKDMHDRDSL